MSRRTERVAELLRAEIARLLRAEVADPRIGLVTLTRVDVAPDFRSALVFWSRLNGNAESDIAESGAGLESAAPFLRTRLAEELPLKRVPELRFRFDPSLELGDQTLATLRGRSRQTGGLDLA